MRGSLLMTFDQIEGEIADSYRVYVNGQLRDRHYTSITNLYSTFLELDDVVFIEYFGESTNYSIINVTRTDYTTDSENNDNGIKDIFIDSLEGYGPLSGITFTATTTPDSYKYNYNINISQLDCFYIGTGFSNNVYDIELQSDGKIICGGVFNTYDNATRNKIIRLNSDGSIDNTFNIGTGFNASVYSIIIQSDDKIVISGNFTIYNGTSLNRIIRLNSNGNIDNTFNSGSGFNNIVYTSVIQSDGKIICGGIFTTYNGSSQNRLIRLNSNGSKDTTFNIGTGFNGTILDIKIQSDGKILCVGSFNQYQGQFRNRIIRLNSDGSIDNTFNIGTGFPTSPLASWPWNLEIQSDNKILIGGGFGSYNGTPSAGIIRLNTDGSVDNTFIVGTGLTPLPSSPAQSDPVPINITSDNKLIVGGRFTAYNGTTANRIVRINSDGTEDMCP